jgi:uncharacterized membrane protein YccC
MKLRLSRVQREFVAWGKTEGLGWVFVFKTTIAALLAMGISMRFELGQPVTAMVTVYVIMQPQTGMVLTKSFYRICGTLAGMVASLALLGLFAQERVLFLLGLSIWVGLCTAGAALYRNFKSYGFTLAGYTTAMIAFPLVMQPTGFFDYAVNRATEVVVGILCAGIVSDMVFPQSLGDSILRTIQSRYTEFNRFAHAILSGEMEQQEMDRMHLRFIGNAMNLESFRSSVLLEATEFRSRDLTLRRLNQDFMAMSTTIHSFYQLMNHLKKTDSPATQALAMLSGSLADMLVTEGEPARTADQAQQAEQRFAAFHAAFPQQVETVRNKQLAFSDNPEHLDCETGVELLNRFVQELRDYIGNYASLIAERQSKRPLDDVRFASRTDPTVAILTGARATTVILLVAAFWIASAWPYGTSAVMMAAIGSALFAPAPDPALAVKMGVIGVLASFIVSFLCKFFVLTSLDGFGLLCAGMVPFMLVGPYLCLNPKLATMGLGYSTMFCFMISPANSMQYDPVSFINFGTALAIGLATAAVIFGTFAPVTGAWYKRRTAHMLRRQVEMACFEPLPGLTHRFESGIRDILHRVAAKQELQDPHVRNILEWMFIVLEMGRAIIHLRQDADSIPFSQPLLDNVNKCICSTADLFRQPNTQCHTTALESIDSSINFILQESGLEELDRHQRDAMRRMLTSLHLIRASLMDDDTVLAATVTGSQATLQGGTLYAA